jgi:hypothetical protein
MLYAFIISRVQRKVKAEMNVTEYFVELTGIIFQFKYKKKAAQMDGENHAGGK